MITTQTKIQQNTPAFAAGVFLFLATLFSLSAIAQETKQNKSESVHYNADEPAAHVKVDGDSTLHAWSVEGKKALGYGVLENGPSDALIENGELAFSLQKGVVKFPVKSIKGKKEGLNKKMYKALDADNHKYIVYEPNSLELIERSGDRNVRVESKGKMTIAGTSRSVTIKMNIKQVAPGRLMSTGETNLKMTDFDIEPPTALGGVVTAEDQVTVSWKFPVIKRYTPTFSPGSIFREANEVLLKRYKRVRDALANGESAGADRYLEQMKKLIGRIDLSITDLDSSDHPEVQQMIDKLNDRIDQTINAGSLSEKRSNFGPLTSAIEMLVRAIGHTLEKPVRVMKCTGTSEPNHWLSISENGTKCPYVTEAEDHEDYAIRSLAGSDSN